MDRLKKMSLIYLLDIVIYICGFNLIFYLLNPHHTTLSTSIWWLFCIGLILIFKWLPNDNLKLPAALAALAIMLFTNLYTIYTIAFTFVIVFYLIKIQRILTMGNLFIFQLVYFSLVFYLNITGQNNPVYQSFYLFIMVLLTLRIGLYIASAFSKSITQKMISVLSAIGVAIAGTYIFSVYIIPFFRSLLSGLIFLLVKAMSVFVEPVYQTMVQIFQRDGSNGEGAKENVIDSMNQLMKPQAAEGGEFLYIKTFTNRSMYVLLLVVVLYGSYRLVKSLRKAKLQVAPMEDVQVRFVEQVDSASPIELVEYMDEIDRLINQLFIAAEEKEIPKKEDQTIRVWAGTLPFQVSEEWIQAFEDIRYSGAANRKIPPSFIQQSQEMIQQLNQIPE